ncbi:MAG TPA: DUF5362 family protein, partial [Verrucomicrobiales bacterium]|nr:DUF5362 family protein [Verrucomicrobiales bacterium]
MQWYYLSDSDEQIPVEEEQLLRLIQEGIVRSDTQVWREDMADWYEARAVLPDLFGFQELRAPEPAAVAQAVAAEPVAPAGPRGRPRLIVGPEADSRTSGQLLTRKPLATSTRMMAPVATGAPSPDTIAAGGVSDSEVNLVRQLAAPLVQAQGWMKLAGVVLIITGIPYLAAFGLGGLFIWMGILLFQAAGRADQAALLGHKFLFLEAQRKLKTFFTVVGVTCLVSIIASILLAVVWGAALIAMVA